MKSRLTRIQRATRNEKIVSLFTLEKWSIRKLQKHYGFKSPKSIYNIIYPERYNKYQLARYHTKKAITQV